MVLIQLPKILQIDEPLLLKKKIENKLKKQLKIFWILNRFRVLFVRILHLSESRTDLTASVNILIMTLSNSEIESIIG